MERKKGNRKPAKRLKTSAKVAKLTMQQANFCRCLVVENKSQKDAALEAGYTAKYPDQTANNLLKNPRVQNEIARLREKLSMRSLATRDRWLEEICRLAFADTTKLFEADGSLKRFVDMDEDTRRTIIALDVAEIFSGSGDDRQAIGLLKKIKCADKLGALQLLGKAERWLVDRVEHSGKVSLEQLVAGGEANDE